MIDLVSNESIGRIRGGMGSICRVGGFKPPDDIKGCFGWLIVGAVTAMVRDEATTPIDRNLVMVVRINLFLELPSSMVSWMKRID